MRAHANEGGITRRLLDLLFPQNNICHLCGRALSRVGEAVLCASCEEDLLACRLLKTEAESAHPPLQACASAYAYVGRARELVLALKFGHDRAAALPLAAALCDAYADAPELLRADIVAPVPLHEKRERERGYNQAELLARGFSAHTGLRLCPDAVTRLRNTKPQTGKSREERLTDMSGAFSASSLVENARVLLIDDVLTTGATLAACAEALLAAGCAGVSALTVARSMKGMLGD